jgi:molybdenum cofactor biosynthesis enzyme MoaA
MCLFSDEEVNLKELLRGGCSDAELVALIDRAIKMKPRDLKESTIGMNLRKCSMEMSSIGG